MEKRTKGEGWVFLHIYYFARRRGISYGECRFFSRWCQIFMATTLFRNSGLFFLSGISTGWCRLSNYWKISWEFLNYNIFKINFRVKNLVKILLTKKKSSLKSKQWSHGFSPKIMFGHANVVYRIPRQLSLNFCKLFRTFYKIIVL